MKHNHTTTLANNETTTSAKRSRTKCALCAMKISEPEPTPDPSIPMKTYPMPSEPSLGADNLATITDTSREAYFVICIDPETITPDGLGVRYREVITLARDLDEAMHLAKEFLGSNYVPVTAMTQFVFSEYAALLADHGLTEEAPIMESSI